MPKLASNRLPAYQKHRVSKQAVVKLNGKFFYLGPYGTKTSKLEYDRLIGEWIANGRQLPNSCGGSHQTINELAVEFVNRHVKLHYIKAGKPTAEQRCISSALRVLKETYGHTIAAEFGPLALKALREKMIQPQLVKRKFHRPNGDRVEKMVQVQWSRKYINKTISRIRQFFKWCVSEQLIPVTVYQALQCVQGLQAGRSEAKETAPRHAVPEDHINEVRKVVKQRYRDLIDLALLTGARPGELIGLTPEMIDQSGEIWIARLREHKNVHHGKSRTIFFGPKAQLILNRYLSRALFPCNRLFPIKVNAFRDAIVEACNRVGIERFTPHWLRHSAATRVRDEFGVEGSQSILGHARIDMTALYAAKSEAMALQIARQVG